MDFMFLSNSQIHILSFVFDFDWTSTGHFVNMFVFGFVKCNILWYIDDDGHVNMENFPLMINFRTERRYSGPAHVQFQKIWIRKEATQVHLPNQCISNWWFSVCLRIFCLIVLILLPKLLALEQQIPDLVSSVFGCGVDIVKESIEDKRPAQQAA